MAPFLLRLTAFALLQVGVGSLFVLNYEVDRTAYMAATLDKHQRAATVPSPRVLIAGGSSLAFGMDGERLERELGLPVVNLALHLRLGTRFHLAEALSVARAGDVVLLSTEQDAFIDPDPSVPLFELLEQRPAGMAHVAWADVPWMLDMVHTYLGRIVRRGYARMGSSPAHAAVSSPPVPYRRDAFDVRGDHVAHLDMAARAFSRYSSWERELPRRRGETLDLLAAFRAQCAARGVTALWFWPALTEPFYGPSAALLERLDAEIRTRAGLQVLNGPQEVAFPTDHFWDSPHHLARRGRDRLTSLLAPRLRAAIEEDRTR